MNLSDLHNLDLCLINEFGRNANSILFWSCADTGMSVFCLRLARVPERIWGPEPRASSYVDDHVMDSCDESTRVPNPRVAAVADLCHLSGYRSLFVMYCTVNLD